MILSRSKNFLLILMAVVFVASCASKSPPRNPRDACQIMREKDGWYEAMAATRAKYGIPISSQLAIMRQESAFVHDARPPRTYFLFIPTGRISSAYGYSQALDGTWDHYQKSTGNRWADRDDFDDASDFIGWYTSITHRRYGVPFRNVRDHYIAYYVGHGGYGRGKWKSNDWLLKIAAKVQRYADNYYDQLSACEDEFR
ncbi:MAG TPA: hypothetical protein DHV03_07585 [Alphaproteobacteria bacterium]|nr:hypothetical protein [Alphaproteobacteria bacterium]